MINNSYYSLLLVYLPLFAKNHGALEKSPIKIAHREMTTLPPRNQGATWLSPASPCPSWRPRWSAWFRRCWRLGRWHRDGDEHPKMGRFDDFHGHDSPVDGFFWPGFSPQKKSEKNQMVKDGSVGKMDILSSCRDFSVCLKVSIAGDALNYIYI